MGSRVADGGLQAVLRIRFRSVRKGALIGAGLSLAILGASCGGATEQTTSDSIAVEPEGITVGSISSSELSETTATSTSLPTTPLATGEPFIESFDPDDLPELPEQIDGYVRYEGIDSAGLSGQIRTGEIRVFQSESDPEVIWDFSTRMNNCSRTIWVLRWKSTNTDVVIKASHEIDSYGVPLISGLNPWNAPAASAGIMSNSACLQPGFVFGGAMNGNPSNLVDVALEWSYFDKDEFASSASSTETKSCTQYIYDDELPIEPCSQGYSVTLFQETIGLEAEGFFGPGMQRAVVDLRREFGLPESLVVDSVLWRRLGILSGAPYPDLNGDDVIDGSEVLFD